MSGKELPAVGEAFASNYIAPLGPQVLGFEEEFSAYTKISHSLALSSGTAGIHLALLALGVEAGDEVLASSLTFIGSVTPVTFRGATPVFIDCDRTSWNIDPALLAEELATCAGRGQLPKAVVPTDLYGQCADYGRIFSVCERYGVPVIVDAAEAMGAVYFCKENEVGSMQGKYRDESIIRENGEKRWPIHAGKGAKAAVFSFNGNKIITTSGGGMLVSDDEELIEHARFLSQQARDPFPHYEHTEIGYNYRMSNILAAIGRGQLRVLDERVKRKREIFEYYHAALSEIPGIEFMPEAPYGRSNRWLTVILVTPDEFGCDRETIRLALEEKNIESRPVWKPMHMQPVFSCSGIKLPPGKKQHPARAVGGAVAEDLFNRGLCLPSGTAMTNSDLDRIIDTIMKCHRR